MTSPPGRPGGEVALPPVERVRPGLWSIPVPIPTSSLTYVLVYVFETDEGPYLVDAGWNTDEAYDALSAGLAAIGTSIGAVRGVLVTHIHPDHYGLAGRVREMSGAWIALHPADAELVHDRYLVVDELLEELRVSLRELGAPEPSIEALAGATLDLIPLVAIGGPDLLLEDGDRPPVPGFDLVALWTPGHSPGHLCFHELGQNLLLSGDHVLPRITPHVAMHPQSGPDPLGDFLASLDRVAALGPAQVLPAHEYRFSDLAGRVEELHAHHRQRFVEAIAAVGAGHDTVWAVAAEMSWSRPWAETGGFMRRAAAFETFAHLNYLERRGLLTRHEGSPLRFTPGSGAQAVTG